MESDHSVIYTLALTILLCMSTNLNAGTHHKDIRIDSSGVDTTFRNWGFGVQFLFAENSTLDIIGLYKSKNRKIWQFTAGTSFTYELEYNNGDGIEKTIPAKVYHLALGVNFPSNTPSDHLYFQTEVFSKIFRSDEVNDWIAFDHLPYQKRFAHHYDVNVYGIRAGIRWMPELGRGTHFDISLLPEFYYYHFPDQRQSDPLYIYPVRDTMIGGNTGKHDKYGFSLVVKIGLTFMI